MNTTGNYLPVPSVVQWLSTLRCGQACQHCFAACSSGPGKDMPFEKVTALIDEIARLGIREFLVAGGEPMAREDIADIIALIGHRKITWSLNSTVLPSPDQQTALSASTPAYVAVSLDGPRDIHDAFRRHEGSFDEVLEAIHFYRSLNNIKVGVGTTVTTMNFDSLEELFHVVANSSAHCWGLHLPVPEGRAATRKDLFLSKQQIKRMMQFVAEKRRQFDVVITDHLGYCGEWEPLVRNAPLMCGAGRLQCVVLPDGEVVPCMTLDRSTSAGNLNESSLLDIWKNGFGELRAWTPEKRCRACDYLSACQGGCWLMRRHGTGCFKSVWQVPAALKTAAGIMICTGSLYAGAQAQESRILIGESQGTGIQGSIPAYAEGSVTGVRIISWYSRWVDGEEKKLGPMNLDASFSNDVGIVYLNMACDGKLPADFEQRIKLVSDGLGATGTDSLSLGSLLWRGLAEVCLDGKRPQERTPAERKALREVMSKHKRIMPEWQKRAAVSRKATASFSAAPAFEFAARHAMPRHDFRPVVPLAALSPEVKAEIDLLRDTDKERWGKSVAGESTGNPVIPDYGAGMDLTISGKDVSLLQYYNPRRKQPVNAGDYFGVHDILLVPEKEGGVSVTLASDSINVPIQCPAGTELTYPDLLRLAHEQNAELLAKHLSNQFAKNGLRLNSFANPLLLGAARERLKGESDKTLIRGLRLWLADFWLF